jgi:ribosomal protein L11 methyltransferase
MKTTSGKWLKYRFRKNSCDWESLIVKLHEIGCLGVIEGEEAFEAFFEPANSDIVATAVQKLTLTLGYPASSYESEYIANQDWHLNWQKYFSTIHLTPNIVIHPYWKSYTGNEKVQIAIKPGMAFGTGTHPTTQMTLRLLEQYLHPGMSVLDAGCGSGILTIAAIQLGAGFVAAWDIDPDVENNFHENLELNRIKDRFSLKIGDVTQLKTSQFDLILSNIVLKSNLALLAHIHIQGGTPTCIFSGILQDESAMFKSNVLNYRLFVQEELNQEEWIALAIV